VLGEDLDSVSLAGRLFNTEIDFGKVALAKLLQKRVLLQEVACLAGLGVAEHEARLAVDGNLILLLQFATLISADNGFIDVGSIAREVFDDRNGVVALILGEDQAVSVRNNSVIDDNVCSG
jgi:hypothetical protein